MTQYCIIVIKFVVVVVVIVFIVVVVVVVRTIVYELMSLEHPYKSYPLETQIWRVGKGKVQGLMLLARGQLRSVIARCWKETPDHRPGFKDILAMLEQDVSTC